MRTMLIILSILITVSSYAHETCEELEFHELSDLLRLQRKITWEAATKNEIAQAKCLRKKPFTIDEMSEWLKNHESSVRINKQINGINFENETPENLDTFFYLTTYLDLTGSPDPKKNVTRSSQCKKVDCALKEIFGPETGVQLQYMQQRYGLNGSHIVKRNSSAWKKEELDTVLLAISDFPEGILPFEKSRTLVHAERGLDTGKVLANATIMIFDLWNTQSPENRRATIFHELAHAIGGVTEIDESIEWMEQGGWATAGKVSNGKLVINADTSRPETAVSKYGMTNEREDFAESVVAYRYNPNHLKEKSIEKYRLIKDTIFDGVEYTSEKACEEPDRISQMAKDNISSQLNNWSPSNEELKAIANRCSEEAISNFASEGSLKLNAPLMEFCYNKSIQLSAIKMIQDHLKDNANFKFMAPMFRNVDPDLSNGQMINLLSKTKEYHRNSLRTQVSRAISGKNYCSPVSKAYANQAYNQSEIGFNPFNKNKDFSKIRELACPKLKNSNADKVVEELIQ